MNHTLSIFQDQRGFLSVSSIQEIPDHNRSQRLLGHHEFSHRDLVLIQNFEPPPLNTSQGDLFAEDFMHIYISKMIHILLSEGRYSHQFIASRKKEYKIRTFQQEVTTWNPGKGQEEKSYSQQRVQYVQTRLMYTLREENP